MSILSFYFSELIDREIAGVYKQKSQSQVDPTLGGDSGIARRYKKTGNSISFRIYAPIQSGITSASRYLPNLVDLKFVYSKSDPKFHYTCDATITAKFHLEIKQAHLALKRVKLYPSVESAIIGRLNSGTSANFYYRNEYARNFSIAKDFF